MNSNNNTCSETEQENKSEKLSLLTIKTLGCGLGCGEVGGEGFGYHLVSSHRLVVVVLLCRQEGRLSLLFARLFVYSAEERAEARDKREQTN